MFDDCISKKVVRHVPFNLRKLASKVLEFSNHSIRFVMTGKRVKQCAGFGLEIPVDYRDSTVTTWFKETLETLGNSLNVKVEKGVK